VSWRSEYLDAVVRDDIPSLSEAARRRIRKAIEVRLSSNPVELGKPLRYSFKGARRLRVGTLTMSTMRPGRKGRPVTAG
jgi:mRNA interferase RelE/StbE